MPSLELSMIVKNGAATLARCLESVRGIVDRIVIGDTGSTDSTIEVACRLGAQVIPVTWENDFSRARNAVLRHATADWVLFLDADELLDSAAARAIPALLLAEGLFGYQVEIWNYVPSLTNRFWDSPAKPNPHRIPAARHFPAYVHHTNVRLFRRHPDILFEKRVHEGVADRMARLGLAVGEANFVIHHLGIAEDEAAVRQRKNELYRSMGQEKIRENPDDPLAHFELGMTELESFRNPAAALAYFERVVEVAPGTHLAWMFAGICLVRLGKFEQGLRRLERAQHLGGRGPVLLEAQGDAHYHLEDFREARLQYQGAVSRGGRSAVLESKLGACEVRLGLRNQGLRRIEQAVASEPHFPELYDILIAAALFAGDAHLAAHAARGRLHVGDPAPEDFLQAAGLLAPLGDLNAVREVVQAGCERYPNSENLRLAIIEVDNARSQALAGHNVAV